MNKEEKYKVLFVNVLVIMFIDLFTKGTLVGYTRTELIRCL